MHADAFDDAGLNAFHRGEWQEAERLFTQAIGLNPREPRYYYHRGNLYTSRRCWQEGIADLSRAIALYPQYVYALVARGVAYCEIRQYELALADLTLAVQLDPGESSAWYNRGTAYRDLKRWSEAHADLAQAVRLKPDKPNYLAECGMSLVAQNRHAEAIPYLSRAIDLGLRNSDYLTNRGYCYSLQKDYAAALADLNAALQLEPDNYLAFMYRSFVWEDMKDDYRAFDDVCSAIRVSGGTDGQHGRRAELFLKAGRPSEALADVNLAIAKNPGYLSYLETRAAIYAAIGRPDLADQDRTHVDRVLYQDAAELLPRAQRVTVALIQANIDLYDSRRETDRYCLVLLTFDPSLQADIPRLKLLAERVHGTKGKPQPTPELQYVSSLVTNEVAEKHRRRQLPPSFTGGSIAYAADLKIHRRFLPERKLPSSGLLSCLAEPGDQGRIELTPPGL